MEVRQLRRDDRDAALEIWNRAARYDRLTAALFDEKTWGDDDFDPDLARVAVTAGVIAGFGVGVLRRDTGRGYVKLLAVDPGRQRQGIGRALLDTLETGLAEKGAHRIRLLEAAPNYLTPGIDTRDGAALAFAAAAAYRRVGEALNLAVDLTAGRTVGTVPAGVDVRRAAPADAAALHAFLDAHWPAWQAEAGTALRNAPPTLHLAWHAGRIVGFAAWDANNLGTGGFGPMGVAPAARRTGIGGILLHRCLDDIRAQGHDAAVIAWADNAPFYERCAGARRARTFVRFEKSLHED